MKERMPERFKFKAALKKKLVHMVMYQGADVKDLVKKYRLPHASTLRKPGNSGPSINEKNIPIMKRICLLFNDEALAGGGFQFWHVDGYTSFGFS